MSGTCSYPHPVLGNLDDLDGSVELEISVVVDDAVRITGAIFVHNNDVAKLIENGDAVAVIRCTCRRTYMRTSCSASDGRFEIEIDKNDLSGEVRLEPFILAAKIIKGYAPPSMNSEYGSASFDLDVGQVIAVLPVHSFEPKTDFDPLRNLGASLIEIASGGRESEPYEVDYELDRILLRISDSAWRSYQGVKNRVPMMVILALVVPVLSEALKRMGEDADQLEDYKWYQRLGMILSNRGIELPVPDSLSVAQSLVSNPLTDALGDLDERLSHDEGDDE